MTLFVIGFMVGYWIDRLLLRVERRATWERVEHVVEEVLRARAEADRNG